MNKFELNSQLLKITKANIEIKNSIDEYIRKIEGLTNVCTLIHDWSSIYDKFKLSKLPVYIFCVTTDGAKVIREGELDELKNDEIFAQYKISYKGDDVYELENMLEQS